MSGADFTVFLVDDDRGVLKALSCLLRAAAYEPLMAPNGQHESLQSQPVQ